MYRTLPKDFRNISHLHIPILVRDAPCITTVNFSAGLVRAAAFARLDVDDVVIGTIGAYDYKDGRIEVGFSIVPAWQGRGYATDALKKVLEYLTQNEGIPCVTAWCAAENTGSKRVLEKAGMRLVGIEQDGLVADGRVYDKMYFEYREEKCLLESSEMTSQK